jgi:vacuolar-type H+-ATPase subunit I/STV1
MQVIDLDKLMFSQSLAGALIFGLLFAFVVRWASKRKMVGQTAWAVVIGVTFTLLSMIPVFGIEAVAIMFCYFGAAGSPMIVEYLLRVQTEIQKDHDDAKGLAKDLINDRQASDR